MNQFSLIIKNKGWTVVAACEHWGIAYRTFYNRINDPRYYTQMLDMCNGLKEIESEQQ